jgi:hypothetical protein
MGLIDNQLMYSDSQVLTTTGAVSTNYVDHGAVRNLGAGDRMYVFLTFGAVVSNATLTATLQGTVSDNTFAAPLALTTGKTITPVAQTFYAFPIAAHVPCRYTRVNLVMAGGTGPSITASCTLVRDTEVHLADMIY